MARLRLYDRLDVAKDPRLPRSSTENKKALEADEASRDAVEKLVASRVTVFGPDCRSGCLETAPHRSAGTAMRFHGASSARTTHETPTIRKTPRVQGRSPHRRTQRGTFQLKQSTLDETYNRRSGVERTNDAVFRTAASGTFAPGAASTQSSTSVPRAVPRLVSRSAGTNAITSS